MTEFVNHIVWAIIYIAGIGVIGFLVGRLIPKRKLDHTKFPFKEYAFEDNGKLYERLGLRNWQDKVPDMSRIMKKIMPPKKMEGTPNLEQVLRMIRETCMAELIHMLLSVLGFLIPVICPNIIGWLIAIIYIGIGNLPFVIIQRYNRPRLVKLYETQKRMKLKKPTNVLIMSANTGGGHNSVARTLKEYYVKKGYSVDIVDALSFKSEEYSKFISGTHTFVYNHMPWLFSFGWAIVEHSSTLQFGEYSLNRLGFKAASKELYRCITDNGYTTVICTHVFAAIMIGDTVKKYSLMVKTGRVETDYMNTPGAEYGFVDYHFVPSYMMIPQMVGRGAERDTIVVSGIPLPEEDHVVPDKEEAKKKLGLPLDKTHIFIMFGSEGNGPIEDILKRLKKGLEHPAFITVVCGRNEKLYQKLMDKYGDEPDIKIYGFATNVPDLMDSTDIFIGKSGGISITEAAVRKLAIMIVLTVGGCEKYNKEFFVNHGAALSVTAVNYIAKECNMLISDKELNEEVCNAARDLIKTGSAKIIFDTLTGVDKSVPEEESEKTAEAAVADKMSGVVNQAAADQLAETDKQKDTSELIGVEQIKDIDKPIEIDSESENNLSDAINGM